MRFTQGLRALEDRRPFEQTGLLRGRGSAIPHGSRLLHSTGAGENQRLMVRHLVFHMLSPGASDFPVHARLVTLEERQVVTGDRKFRGSTLRSAARRKASADSRTGRVTGCGRQT
jgi:hypothetical protein